MTDRNPRVSLAMIVRDEERCLARALRSAAHLVDDMVVVDTGSVDGTAEIAQSNGARVEHFPWIDDFAAARNHALSVAGADAVIMLDADEWVEPTTDPSILRQWVRRTGGRAAGVVTVASETESDGDLVTTHAQIVRVVPRGARFVGRIHEQATGFDRTTAVEGLLLHHDGYRPAQVERKRGRNERLLRQLLANDPHDPYLLFQLGRERQIAGAYAEAAEAYLSALPGVDDTTAWRDDARARVIYSLHRAGRTDDALTATTRLLRDNPSAEVLFAAGNLFLDLAVGSPHRRHEFLPMARSAWRACLGVGEPTDGRDGTPGCGSFLAAGNLAALCEAEGDEAGQRRWRELARSLRHEGASGTG